MFARIEGGKAMISGLCWLTCAWSSYILYAFRCRCNALSFSTAKRIICLLSVSPAPLTHRHTHTKVIIIDRRDHKNSWWNFQLKLHQLLSDYSLTRFHTHTHTTVNFPTLEMVIRYQMTGYRSGIHGYSYCQTITQSLFDWIHFWRKYVLNTDSLFTLM